MFRNLVANPAQRRQIITLTSGSLIVAALAAGKLLEMGALRDGLMFLAALIAGADIAQRALYALRNRHISIELLVTIATAGALAIGEYWEAAAVTFLFMLGAYLEARTMSRTRRALQELLELTPTSAIVLRDGQQVEVMPHEVAPGEIVLVKPGAKIPVDGEVIAGRAAINESAITGESLPVDKSEGDTVFAGTVSQNGLLQVRATGVGADTTLARIVRRVEEAQDERAPTQRFIERFAQWYTPFIILLSAAAYGVTRNVELALTLLVIGCPGALVISTPVSVVAGIGQAAKRGILIKGGEYLENAAKISALALDKTGTLTRGEPRLTDVIALDPGADDAPSGGRYTPAQQRVLRWAAIAESGSEHPLAVPVVAEARALGELPHADAFENLPGRGIVARCDGRRIAVGTGALLEGLGIEIEDAAQAHLAALKSAGKTAVLVALDGQAIGVLGISDVARDTAPEMVARLRRAGLKRIVMLTGDDPRAAQAIGSAVGIDEIYAGLLPEDKLERIRHLQREGHVVAMVGDGVNDAPALAAADIGIAMGAAGTDVALETADIALMADDLLKIPEAIELSKATLRNIHQNVIIALLTVSGLLAGVLAGQVHMAGGMFIHELSVLVVILNGMRLLRGNGTIRPAERVLTPDARPQRQSVADV